MSRQIENISSATWTTDALCRSGSETPGSLSHYILHLESCGSIVLRMCNEALSYFFDQLAFLGLCRSLGLEIPPHRKALAQELVGQIAFTEHKQMRNKALLIPYFVDACASPVRFIRCMTRTSDISTAELYMATSLA